MMEVATGRVAGYEALSRFAAPWERPPHLWFAQAQRCGLSAVLEAHALRAALAVAERPAGTFLALNVSPAGLLTPEVEDALPRDLDGIVIELTEHEAFDADGALELALTALRSRGAQIALDDAGAGYAGLQQLIRVRPDIVKVDRSLVAGIHEDASKLALLEALAHFATTTGAAVCAEGVEELTELRALARVDVTYAQGYALARPGPAWPVIPAAVAAEVASADHHGMRLAGMPVVGAAPSLAEMTDVLARARRSRSSTARCRASRSSSAPRRRRSRASTPRPDASSRSAITPGRRGRAVRARRLPDDRARDRRAGDRPGDRGRPGQRPGRARGARDGGDAGGAADAARPRGRRDRAARGLRRSPQAWTNTQVDLARVLANHIAASLVRVTASERAAPRAGRLAAAGAALARRAPTLRRHARHHPDPRPGRLGAARRVPEPPPRRARCSCDGLALGICGTDARDRPRRVRLARRRARSGSCSATSRSGACARPRRRGFSPGDLVVGIVRRPDPVPCACCARGEWDFCRNGHYTERGIKELHGFGVRALARRAGIRGAGRPGLEDVGVLLEPTSVVAKAWEQIERIGGRACFDAQPRARDRRGADRPAGGAAGGAARLRGPRARPRDRGAQAGARPAPRRRPTTPAGSPTSARSTS